MTFEFKSMHPHLGPYDDGVMRKQVYSWILAKMSESLKRWYS